jgi:hypothetical protein
MNLYELIRSLVAAVRAQNAAIAEIQGTTNAILTAVSPNPCPAPMRRVCGIVFNVKTGALIMSGTTGPIALVNVATPAAATRYLGVIDITNGTALPTLAVSSGNAALVALVAATALNANNQFVFGVYPVDAEAETNDLLTVTATLPDGAVLDFDFSISGTPPVQEGETIDPSSAVGSFVGAPTVPSTPI